MLFVPHPPWVVDRIDAAGPVRVAQPKTTRQNRERMHMHKLNVEGMTCGHCEKAVKEALQSVPGSERVEVDLASGGAVVEGPADLQTLIRAVEQEGYRATVAS